MRRTVPPLEACLRPANFWRGWVGLLMIAAGMGAAGLAALAPLVAPPAAKPSPGARPAPPPVVEPIHLSFLPPKGPVGIRVVLEGKGLEQTRSVRFGARETPFRTVSDQRVEVHVPEGAVTGPITLTTAEGALFTSGADFKVTRGVPPAPVITGFRPASGPGGTEVSVAGSGFEPVEEVRVGGRPAEFTLLTDTALVLYVPPDHPNSGPIVLISPFGIAASGEAFQVSGPPEKNK